MKRSRISIDMFLELQKRIDTKLHYRDACNSTVIEIEAKDDMKTIEAIKEFFKEKGIDIVFSEDYKYLYENR